MLQTFLSFSAEQLEEFCVLEDSIASYCETSSCIENVSYLWLEQVVLVDCQENNGCWRRGQVTRIDRLVSIKS